ncbi:MAG: RIP metalloprotease RseP [Chloroherpetonaceae bacterium]|nr:RIP metalloprotease RseP [Chloroherpetonaceae bacterium]MDW8438432.1 RIP metalloprotease RseP [Chloroherpetonaceae bacterium]
MDIGGFLQTVFYFIVAIFILVTVHEFGHFAAAKLFKMRVLKFYVGFDFWNLRLWRTQRGETEYGVGAIPLGGYVQIAGMVDESMDTEFASKPPQPWEFRSKPVWQRLIVISAGVLMNMVLAAVIFIVIALAYGESKTPIVTGVYVPETSVFAQMGFKTGDKIIEVNGKPVKHWEEVLDPELFANPVLTYTILRGDERLKLDAPANMLTRLGEEKGETMRPLMPALVGEVIVGMPAEKAGLRQGDLITKVGDKEIRDWAELIAAVGANKGKEVRIEWRAANGAIPKDLDALERLAKNGATKTAIVAPNDDGKIGVQLSQITTREYVSLGFFEAIGAGLKQTAKMTALTIKGFGKLITGEEDLRKNLGGPVKIARLAGQSAEQGAASFLVFLALLSISLAFINILPIPALDGGQFVLISLEGIIGKELPLKVKMAVQQAGMYALLALMAFIIYNDIANP